MAFRLKHKNVSKSTPLKISEALVEGVRDSSKKFNDVGNAFMEGADGEKKTSSPDAANKDKLNELLGKDKKDPSKSVDGVVGAEV